jgi:preprotein translocase subunit YajC
MLGPIAVNYLPYVIFALLLIGLLAVSKRARSRQAASAQQHIAAIGVGTEVMTTSGLYGTVVMVNDDSESVQMSIAAGVEVKWALAALRDVASLPPRYAVNDDAVHDDDGADDAIEAAGVDLEKGDQPRRGDSAA